MFCIGCKMFSPTPKHIFLSTFYATVIKNVFCLLFRWVLWYDNFEQCDTYRNAVPGLHIKMVVLTVGPFSFSLRMDIGFLINDVYLEATISIHFNMEACDSTLLPRVPEWTWIKSQAQAKFYSGIKEDPLTFHGDFEILDRGVESFLNLKGQAIICWA